MSDVLARLDALERLIVVGEAHVGATATAESSALLARSRGRLRHGSTHTVAAIAGSTGAGKSSLLNALVGADVATTGVRRPTTSQTQAVVWTGEGAEGSGPVSGGPGTSELLDWLEVTKRHFVAVQTADEMPDLDGLVLLDLPDHDSIEAGNRAEVDRLVGLVDLFVWVADPQKYADESLHNGYLKRLAGHGDVMVFVLSKVDTLDADAASSCAADFVRLISADGIADPDVVPVSAVTGQGIDVLRSRLGDVVAGKAATVDRIDADLRDLGTRLSAEGTGSATPARSERDLIDGLTAAADGDGAATAIAAHHRHIGRIALGWPPTRWARRFKKSPISELPTVSNSPTMVPQVHTVLRDYGEANGAGFGEVWRAAIRATANEQATPVIAQLDRVGASTFRSTSNRPKWWSVGASVQWLAAAIALLGALWLVALVLIDGFLRLDVADLTPEFKSAPLPTWLLLGGLLAGVVLTWLLRVPLAAGARRRGLAARASVAREVELVAQETVVPAVATTRSQAMEYRDLVTQITH